MGTTYFSSRDDHVAHVAIDAYWLAQSLAIVTDKSRILHSFSTHLSILANHRYDHLSDEMGL